MMKAVALVHPASPVAPWMEGACPFQNSNTWALCRKCFVGNPQDIAGDYLDSGDGSRAFQGCLSRLCHSYEKKNVKG